MQLVTPAFRVTQDADAVVVHVACSGSQTRRARIVANAHTFGCYADPLYLPLALPGHVQPVEGEVELGGSPSDLGTFDSETGTLSVRLVKVQKGETFPGLHELRPQILSDAEYSALERDAEKMAGSNTEASAYPIGLTCARTPVRHPLYEQLVATGKLPYLEVTMPHTCSPEERTRIAEANESAKWDEGMFLTVDPDGLVTDVLAQRIQFDTQRAAVNASGVAPPVERERALALLLQVLFAYAYEMRASCNDPTPESAWTVCKLCRALVCFADPLPSSGKLDGSGMHDLLRAFYRRALTYPLYRAWAICERVRHDVADLLRGETPQAASLVMLDRLDGMFSLATTGTGAVESTEAVLFVIWDTWLAPLRSWLLHTSLDDTLHALGAELEAALSSDAEQRLFKDEVGTPGEWDLEALEQAGREAALTGEGGFV